MMNESSVEKGLAVILRPEFADGAPCAERFYRYASSDMTDDETIQFQAHLAVCEVCRRELEVLSELDASAALGLHSKRRGRLITAAASMAAMIAAVMVWQLLVPEEPGPPRDQETPTFRAKSGYQIQVAVERKGQRFAANSGDEFEAGDLLGFFYTAPTATWPVVLYSDAEGNVEQIFPEARPEPMPAGVEMPLPVSAVLEAGEGCEWIAAFFSTKSPNLKQLESAFKRAVSGRNEDCVLKQMQVPNTSIDIIALKRKRTTQ